MAAYIFLSDFNNDLDQSFHERILPTFMYKGASDYNMLNRNMYEMATDFMYASMEYAFPIPSQKELVGLWVNLYSSII